MPDYFPAPTGSGAVGEGGIGNLIIGGLSFPWQDTIISQYANSDRIVGLCSAFAAVFDQKASIDEFYDLVMNLQTATTWGLDTWGRIVGVNRVIAIAPTKYLGFNEGGTVSYTPFNDGPLYSGQKLTSAYSLSNDAFRQLIIAKAAANLWDGSIPGINIILRFLYPMMVAYVVDNNNMTMTYHFGWTLSPVEASVAISSGVLPRPTGVAVSYIQVP